MMVTHSIRPEVTRRCDVMYDLDVLTQLEADS